MNQRTSTRSLVVLGVASLLLGGAAIGSVATADHDLSRRGGATGSSGDHTATMVDLTDEKNVLLAIRDALPLRR